MSSHATHESRGARDGKCDQTSRECAQLRVQYRCTNIMCKSALHDGGTDRATDLNCRRAKTDKFLPDSGQGVRCMMYTKEARVSLLLCFRCRLTFERGKSQRHPKHDTLAALFRQRHPKRRTLAALFRRRGLTSRSKNKL